MLDQCQHGLAAKVKNPSFLAIHPNRLWLYSVSEVETTDGKKGGGVTAFRIDEKTGLLTRINSQLTGGGAPCHLSIDRQGHCVLLANYSGGSVCSLPIKQDGSLGEVVSLIKHQGKSVNKQRQEAPHAHSINVSPDNKYAFAADLGTDEIRVYQLDSGGAALTPHQIVKTPAGGGPRHFAFHPEGKYAYTNNELTSSVTAFKYDAAKGQLTELSTISTLPKDYHGDNTTAEIKVHRNGRFVFVSNRGHHSIAIFQISAEGKLIPKGHIHTGGKTPRNFNLIGDYLLAANQDSGNVVVFRVNANTGNVLPTGEQVMVAMPVCIVGW